MNIRGEYKLNWEKNICLNLNTHSFTFYFVVNRKVKCDTQGGRIKNVMGFLDI